MSLMDAHPNPFNPATTAVFQLDQAQPVSLTVHNILGQTVAVLQEGLLPAGEHRRVWTASNQASGSYFLKLEGKDLSQVRAITLTK
jgi:hypothetical protein